MRILEQFLETSGLDPKFFLFLYNDPFEGYGRYYNQARRIQIPYSYEKLYFEDSLEYAVYSEENRLPLGYLIGKFLKKSKCFMIHQMVVKKSLRNNGIGTTLIKRFLDTFSEADINKIGVMTVNPYLIKILHELTGVCHNPQNINSELIEEIRTIPLFDKVDCWTDYEIHTDFDPICHALEIDKNMAKKIMGTPENFSYPSGGWEWLGIFDLI